MPPACPIRIKWRKNVCNFCTTRINRPRYILSLKKVFSHNCIYGGSHFQNKKLAIAIAKPIEYLMPKMCLFVKLFGGVVMPVNSAPNTPP